MDTIQQELAEISGITDFSNISKEESIKLLELIGRHKLSETHVKALVEIAPEFIKGQIEALKAAAEVAKGVKETQKEAISTIVNSIQGISSILEKLADKTDSEDSVIKLAEITLKAGGLYIEAMAVTERMNKNNNETWLKIAGVTATIFSVALPIALNVLKRVK